jgi:hypothetical protein
VREVFGLTERGCDTTGGRLGLSTEQFLILRNFDREAYGLAVSIDVLLRKVGAED